MPYAPAPAPPSLCSFCFHGACFAHLAINYCHLLAMAKMPKKRVARSAPSSGFFAFLTSHRRDHPLLYQITSSLQSYEREPTSSIVGCTLAWEYDFLLPKEIWDLFKEFSLK
jgi:hypothetical protein